MGVKFSLLQSILRFLLFFWKLCFLNGIFCINFTWAGIFCIRTELRIGEGGLWIKYISCHWKKKKSQLYNCKDEFCSVRDRSGLVIILVPCSTQRATLHPLSAVLFSAQCYPVSSSPFCPGAPLRWPLSVLLEWHVVCCVEASGSLTCMTRVPVLF